MVEPYEWVDFDGKITALVVEDQVTGVERVISIEDIRVKDGKLYLKGNKIYDILSILTYRE